MIDPGFRNEKHAHAITFTCPGHATLSTGTSPSVHGIVSNDWYAPVEPEGSPIYCGDPALMRVGTLSDQVVARGGKVASLSLKDRGVSLPLTMGHETVGSVVAAVAAVAQGASIVRVHDVAETRDGLAVWQAVGT